jgi:exonuclease V gamma subunit
MRQLQLGKKASRIAWKIIGRGIVALDALDTKASPSEQDDYKEVRKKLLDAWRGGVIIGGVRPKHKLREILPSRILQETELADLKQETKNAKAKAKRTIAVPHKPSKT